NQSSKLDSKESDDQLDKIEIGNIKSLEAKREIDQTLERLSLPKGKKAPGILVLSCFAGTANYLTGSVFVNPWEDESITQAIIKGILMTDSERMKRYLYNKRIIEDISAEQWAKTNMKCLEDIEK
ncbi:trehalose-6-phosphate synthase component TPS1 subunit, partial [Pseudoloma neurophilia]